MNLSAIRYLLCSALIALALATGAAGQESDDSNLPAIDRPGMLPLSSALSGKTTVPLVIPSSLPVIYKRDVKEFFGTVDTLEPDEYEATIGFAKDCHGGNACRIGSLSGMRSKGRQIKGSRNFPFEAGSARRVKLHGGIYGFFVDSDCGANCSDSKIYWRQGEFEYMVGLKAEKLSVVVEFANSAIRNGQSGRSKSNHTRLPPATATQ